MKIKLKNTPEQVELVKAMGSRDVAVAREATEAFAAFIGPVVSKVLLQAGTASAIYSDAPYDEDDNPSLPLDLYYNQSQDYVTTWSQTVAGGLPSSTVEGFSEMKISTYRLDSAVSFLKRYARRGRLDVVSKAVERMSNEVLVKQERNAWAVVLKALAEARSNGAAQIVNSSTAGTLQLVDLSNLMTLVKRINTSYAGGTTTDTYGLTDLFLSPEIMGQVRELAFNPIGTNNAGTKAYETAPNTVREEIFRNAGAGEIFGVTLHQLVELGVGQKYNTLFASLVTANGGVANTADRKSVV